VSFRETIGSRSYAFDDINTLLPKRFPYVFAISLPVSPCARMRNAAIKTTLADLPLRIFPNETVSPEGARA
jgi:hypothetical protein